MSFYAMDYYGACLRWRSECERRCREFFARCASIGQGATPFETTPHNFESRCPAFWRGSNRRWG